MNIRKKLREYLGIRDWERFLARCFVAILGAAAVVFEYWIAGILILLVALFGDILSKNVYQYTRYLFKKTIELPKDKYHIESLSEIENKTTINKSKETE